jgi:hypothetical protein
MRSFIKQLIIVSSFIVALTTTFVTTAQGATTAPVKKHMHAHAHKHVQAKHVKHVKSAITTSSPLYIEWSRVAICEEGGWIGSSGPVYPDSLGINATNWYAFGGGSDTSPAAQIAVAQRLVTALGIGIPDQEGCAPW